MSQLIYVNYCMFHTLDSAVVKFKSILFNFATNSVSTCSFMSEVKWFFQSPISPLLSSPVFPQILP